MMNKQLPDDFRDEIAKQQRQEIQRLQKENAELRRNGDFFLSGGEGELGSFDGVESFIDDAKAKLLSLKKEIAASLQRTNALRKAAGLPPA